MKGVDMKYEALGEVAIALCLTGSAGVRAHHSGS